MYAVYAVPYQLHCLFEHCLQPYAAARSCVLCSQTNNRALFGLFFVESRTVKVFVVDPGKSHVLSSFLLLQVHRLSCQMLAGRNEDQVPQIRRMWRELCDNKEAEAQVSNVL